MPPLSSHELATNRKLYQMYLTGCTPFTVLPRVQRRHGILENLRYFLWKIFTAGEMAEEAGSRSYGRASDGRVMRVGVWGFNKQGGGVGGEL